MNVTTLQRLPASCYIFLHATPGRRVAMLMRGVSGFYITDIDQRDMTDAEVKKVVDTLNGFLQVSPETAQHMYQRAIVSPACQRRESTCVAA